MPYIVIEGVIGVGKTALTRLLGEQSGVRTFFEQFEENPFLNSFTQ
jgi:deoxyadenosine/deoxycytidine kinase